MEYRSEKNGLYSIYEKFCHLNKNKILDLYSNIGPVKQDLYSNIGPVNLTYITI